MKIEFPDNYRRIVDACAIFSETDVNGNIIHVNEKFCEISGYTKSELIGENHRILQSGVHDREFFEAMWNTISSGNLWKGDICNRRKDGSIYWVQSNIIAISDDQTGLPTGYVSVRFDITDRYSLLKRIEYLAHYDSLTKLHNRHAFNEFFAHALTRATTLDRKVALLIIDVDHFKSINDRFGHDVGDKVLVRIGGRLKYFTRQGDFVARLGGDEFGLIVTDVRSHDEVQQVLVRIREGIREDINIDEATVSATVSGGYTIFPDDDSTSEGLIRHADQALYKAKNSGRDLIFCHDIEQDKSDIRYRHLISSLRAALNAGHLHLYFQPKIQLSTGKLCGAEALLRWIDPERGIIAPLDFLPQVEASSFAIELSEWVFRRALQFIRTCRATGVDLSVSINVSPKHFLATGFVEFIQQLLYQYPDIKPNSIDLEILESTAIQDFAPSVSVLNQCRDLGVTFSLDDFGTGYSSLSYLKKLPIQTLKIDRSFINEISDSTEDLVLIRAMVDLGKSFGMNVVAEGVESEEQSIVTKNVGCDMAQGYLFSKPMPTDEFINWCTA